MSLNIIFSADTDNEYDWEFLKSVVTAAAEGTLSDRSVEGDLELSVTFTDNAGIHEYNRKYRNIDRPTDVLSFPMYTFAEGDIPSEDEPIILGDMVLSVERAEEQAAEFGHSLRREVAFLTVHSMLHLLGYDHETSDEDEREMFAIQDAIMEKLGITRNN
ncbi:MAG: rRNA maturation RNase YbeY [Ruminococcaceae bacterium]|nr:rRNA maturation RNase YbeY [Oscillospiraceae bacterium]